MAAALCLSAVARAHGLPAAATLAAGTTAVLGATKRAAAAAVEAPGAALPADLAAEARLGLLPLPRELTRLPGVVDLDGPFGLRLTGPTDARLPRAATTALARLAAPGAAPGCLLPCPAPPRIDVRWHAAAAAPVALGADESYRLEVDPAAQAVRIEAATSLGALRGLTTLGQWAEAHGDAVRLRGVRIVDAPRFVWRGLMLDASRHFLGVDTIERTLDAMAEVKLNVLHWHLTDDQGYRLESRLFPRLTGAGSEGQFYTQDQVRRVVAHACRLGIRVVPEIDMPGHVSSWLLGYPDLASGPPPPGPVTSWSIFHAALDPSRESTFQFVDRLLGEVAELFPDAYLHIGGDEVTGVAWRQTPGIRAFMAAHGFADTSALQAYFGRRVAALVERHGRRVVGWDDILQRALPAGAVIQSWSGGQKVREALQEGHATILSHGYYLANSAADHYLNDPAAALPAGSGDPPGLLGAEVCQWTELVDDVLLDGSLWPRTAAVAERLWSPSGVRDVGDMYRRLAIHSDRLEQLGVRHRLALHRRLVAFAGTDNVAVLAQLVDLFERDRQNWWADFNWRRDLDGLADAIGPESTRGRALRLAVDDLVAGRGHPAAADAEPHIRALLEPVIAADGAVAALASERPELAEARVLSARASATARLGLAALAARVARSVPDDAWAADAAAVLSAAYDTHLGVRLALVPGVARLVAVALRPAAARPPTSRAAAVSP